MFLFLVIMNAPARWKIVFALIATLVAGALTGALLTSRAIKDAIPRSEHSRPPSSIATTSASWSDLRLKPEQCEKIKPILRQMSDEFENLRSLALRETEGILSRGQDRMNPILELDQRARLGQIIDDYRHLVREELNIPEPSVCASRAPISANKEPFH
jgi:hypothetical protein